MARNEVDPQEYIMILGHAAREETTWHEDGHLRPLFVGARRRGPVSRILKVIGSIHRFFRRAWAWLIVKI